MKGIEFVDLIRSDRMPSTANSNHGDNESLMGLTTPSSTQASSPSASPALSLTDDRKRNKSESEDNQSQRNRCSEKKTNLLSTRLFSSYLDRILGQIILLLHHRRIHFNLININLPVYYHLPNLIIHRHLHQHRHSPQVHRPILLIQIPTPQLYLFFNIQLLFLKIRFHLHPQQQQAAIQQHRNSRYSHHKPNNHRDNCLME